MDNIVYESTKRYFNTLSNFGYTNYCEVVKVLYLVMINKMVYKYFPGSITEDDYRVIEKSLYNIFGTSCLVPYPQYCNYNNMDRLHAEDATDLINAITHQIEEQNMNIENFKDVVNSDLYIIKSTKVLKSEIEGEEIVPDIIIN